MIGRIIRVQTTTRGDACVGPFEFRGTLVGLFELNGERAIHIVTTNGENHMFTTSQIMSLQMFHPEEPEETEEMLSPIPICEDEVVQIEDDEVVQIEDDEDEVVQEVNEAQEPAEPVCCAICLDATDAARNFVSLDCGHQFHFACIMGNMANGGYNRNQCPMCRGVVVQEYDVQNENDRQNENENDAMEVFIHQAMQRNQRLQHELDATQQYRVELGVEHARIMSLNLQIGTRYEEERQARYALERRAYLHELNERIVGVVASAANNDIRQNYENGAAVHLERQIRELCMNFGMTAYDQQYDQVYPDEHHMEEGMDEEED